MLANVVFLLFIVISSAGGYVHYDYHPMKDMQTCLEVLDHTKTDVAKGGDAESGVAFSCVNGRANQRRKQ